MVFTQSNNLTPVQYEVFKTRGLTCGVVDDEQVFWYVHSIKNWYDEQFTGDAKQMSWADGAWLTRQWVKPLTLSVTIRLVVPAERRLDLWKYVNFVKSQLPIKEEHVVIMRKDGPLLGFLGRVEDKITVKKKTEASPWVDIIVPLVSADSRMFSVDEGTLDFAWQTYETSLPFSRGGLTLPFTVPFVINGRSESGYLDINVDGTKKPRLRFTVFGEVDTPHVHDIDSGERFTLNTFLSEGEYVEILPDEHQVILNGSTSRRGVFSGQWLTLPPGDHRLSFTHEGAWSESARLKVEVLEAF